MIRAAIVGLGRWGQSLVRAAQGLEGLRFTAGFTRTPGSASGFCAEHGIALADSFQALLDSQQLDALVLASPDTEHVAQVERTAAAGKHVFVEKPFALDLAGAERALAAVRQADVTLAVGFSRRFHPAMREVARRVQAGELGRILSITGQQTNMVAPFLAPDAWRMDQAEAFLPPMNAIGVHMVDSMLQLAGPIAEVYVVPGAGVEGSRDTANVLLRFARGGSGSIFCSLSTAPVFRFAVYGTRGVAEVTGPRLDAFAFMQAPTEPPHGPVAPPPTELLAFPGFDMLRAELAEFAAAINEGRRFVVSAEDLLGGVAVLEAALESSKTGRLVTVKVSKSSFFEKKDQKTF